MGRTVQLTFIPWLDVKIFYYTHSKAGFCQQNFTRDSYIIVMCMIIGTNVWEILFWWKSALLTTQFGIVDVDYELKPGMHLMI